MLSKLVLLLIQATIFLVYTAVAMASDNAVPNQNPQFEAIISAWQQRQDRTRSLDFEWEGRLFQTGELSKVMSDPRISMADAAPPDQTFRINRRFVIDESGRSRLDSNAPIWSREKHIFIQPKMMDIFDGHEKKVFSTEGNLEYPSEVISKPIAQLSPGMDWRTKALILVYRPLSKEMGVFNRNSLSLTKQLPVVNNQSVLVLEERETVVPAKDIVETLSVWIDPTKDFVPVRYSEQFGGIDLCVLNISYKHDSIDGWIPISWNGTVKNIDGQIEISDSATVTKFSINKPISESEFNPDPAPGTIISNNINEEEFLVLADGKQRLIQKGEFNGRNYTELLSGDSQRLLPVSGNPWRPWIIAANVFVVFVLLLAVIYRQRRRNAIQTKSGLT